jgi:ABC transport system ATP-binding/permease protein
MKDNYNRSESMIEPILKALVQLFALIIDLHDFQNISGRDREIVRFFLSRQVNNTLVIRYMHIFDDYLQLYNSGNIARGSTQDRKRTSLNSVRILGICEKINVELDQRQKLYVMVQLMDFILFGTEITDNELEFLETVSEAFKIPNSEYQNIKSFILNSETDIPEKNRLMIIDNKNECELDGVKHLFKTNLANRIFLLFIESTNSYILRYSGKDDLFLNGQNILPDKTYIFDHGSTIKGPCINSIFYYDITSNFTGSLLKPRVSINAVDVCLKFKNSESGIQRFNFYEETGNLVGILGGSGVGKTTLLNILSGITKPQSGVVLINGFDLNSVNGKINLKGVISIVPQEDLLIEELTVYQNLYYNARMCLAGLSEPDLEAIVKRTLTELELDEIRDLKVGNSLNKIISGGQRKRLNIALELIREPTILFVDEPTSGLSSVDSEMVMNLLKEQTYKGKLVIINIHQPGSDLYKLFDKIMIIDKGGYKIFYGNPSEAIVYFKTKASFANADEDQCITCGNINSDQLLQIIEAKVVNERGKHTHIRKVTPKEWAEKYNGDLEKLQQKVLRGTPVQMENFFRIPGFRKQSEIFFIRDVLSKLSNKQYILVNILIAPLLAFILAYFTKYSNGGEYLFSENENLPAYLFMCVVTSLFMGLILSAEEIVKDRRILKRESFLNLSWFSYLNSKVMIMFLFSAIQTISFVLVGNFILEIKGMTFSFWLILFTTSCLANLTGLIISSGFNSVITIYSLIPILVIPQLLFSGFSVKFDRLNQGNLTSSEFVPVIGDIMPVRWSFEALAVEQFKNNKYEKIFFKNKMMSSQNIWYSDYLINELKKDLKSCRQADKVNEVRTNSYYRLNYYINYLSEIGEIKIPDKLELALRMKSLDPVSARGISDFLDLLSKKFMSRSIIARVLADSAALKIGQKECLALKDSYCNISLETVVLARDRLKKSVITPKRIIQKYEPGYMIPLSKFGRAQFYAPYKQLGNLKIETFGFNLIILWVVTLILYIALYFNLLQKTVTLLGDLRFSKAGKTA